MARGGPDPEACALLSDDDHGDVQRVGKRRERIQSHASNRSMVSTALSEPVVHVGTGTFWGTVFNILSNVVGGGVLALPYAFANCGGVLGAVLLVWVGGLSGFSMWILMTCSHRLNGIGVEDAFSYKAMMKRAFGPRWGKLVEAFIVWYTFGCCVAYAGVTGSSLAPLADSWMHMSGIWTSRITWTLIAGVLFAITSSVRNLSELKFTSALAFLTIMYVGVVVVTRLFDPESGKRRVAKDISAFYISDNIFKAIPLFSVSYGCHYNIPVFYEDLKNRSPAKMTKIIVTSIIIITSTYLVIATCGYLHFGRDTKSYILEYDVDSHSGSNETDSDGAEFGPKDTLVNIGRLGMFMHFGFVYPLICIACRRSLNLLFDRDLEEISWGQLILQSFGIVVCSVGLAIALKDIGTILDINGSLFGVFIILTFPGALLKTLCQDKTLFPEENKWFKFMSWMLILAGMRKSSWCANITTPSSRHRVQHLRDLDSDSHLCRRRQQRRKQ